jgi:replicative DNA helicase
MKVVRPKAEIQAVFSLLEGTDEVKTELLNALNAEHFGYRPMHEAYSIIEKMITKSALELPSMQTFLESPGLEQETVDILTAPTVSPIQQLDDAKHLVKILEHYRVVRRFYTFSRESLAKLKDQRKVDVDDLMSDVEQVLTDMRSDVHEEPMFHVGRGAESPDDLMTEVFSPEQPKLIPTSFKNFDSKTGGFGGTDFVVLASHAKGGKSILSLNMITNMYLLYNQDVCFIPLEMSKQETAERLISKLSKVEHNKIRTKTASPIELKAMRRSWKAFKQHGVENNCRFTVWPTSYLTTTQIKMKLKPFKYNVICIDYLNLLTDPTNNPVDWQRLSTFARELKLMTKDMNALIIAPTQMNADTGELRYAKAIKDHVNTLWTWFYGEEEAGTHVLTINQPAVRGWTPFKFQLMEDFERMHVEDYFGGELDDDDGGGGRSSIPSMKGTH